MLPQEGTAAKTRVCGRRNGGEKHMSIAPTLREPELKIREIENLSDLKQIGGGQINCF